MPINNYKDQLTVGKLMPNKITSKKGLRNSKICVNVFGGLGAELQRTQIAQPNFDSQLKSPTCINPVTVAMNKIFKF